MGLLAWWEAWQAQRRLKAHAKLSDAVHARVCRLTLDACDLWEMPCVFVDQGLARIVNHAGDGPGVEVLRYEGDAAFEALEAEVRRRCHARRHG